MKYLFILFFLVFLCNNSTCSAPRSKSQTDNYEKINHRGAGITIKNDTFPKKKIYAQYGDIILDQIIDPGEYRYISEDESIQIDQPWDGVLIHQTLENGDEKIEFYDKNHNLLKTIDLDKLNPYTVDKYPLLSSTRGFSGGVESILKHVMDNPNPKQEVSEYRKDTEVFSQDNYFRNIKNTNKHLVVKFDLIKMYSDLVGWECTFVVFDSLGNETGRLENVKYDCAYPEVTLDGKYLGFTYGNTMDDHFHHLFKNEGVKIYDLTSKSIIYEEISDSRGGNPSFGLTQTEDGLFRIYRELQNNKDFHSTYKYLDCVNRLLLEKSFKISDFQEFGKCKSDKQILETFNFEKHQF